MAGRSVCVFMCTCVSVYHILWRCANWMGHSDVNRSLRINRVMQTAVSSGWRPNGAVLSANYVPYFFPLPLRARRGALSRRESRLCWTVSPNRLRAERWSLAAPGLADNKRLAFSRSLASPHPFIAFVAPLCEDLHVGLPNFNLIVLFSASHHQRCHSKPFR